MTKALRDPDLPPGAVVEVDKETGEGIRNDGKRLKPAAQNPWHVLATIAGEQEGTFPPREVDRDLAVRNRRYWNGWACSEMSEDDRAALADKLDLTVADLAPLTEEERAAVEAAFRKRLGPDVAIPEPSERIDFRETHFPHTSVWGKCVFPADASFGSATFCGDAWFESATFSGAAWFESATFCGDAWFESATFCGDAWFESATFTEAAWFGSATFCGDAWFESATFTEAASYVSATFSGAAWFESATFTEAASFVSATFTEAASFGSATFSGDADFRSATFSGSAAFGSATFSGYAWFGSATFSGAAWFVSATFSGAARFESATFSGYPKFVATRFLGAAEFRDATFETPTSFRGAAFEAAFPNLVGAVLHEDTDFWADDWTGVTDKDGKDVTVRAWAPDPGDLKAARDSAAKIRHVLGKQGRPEDEHFFFRKEMGFNARIGGFWRRLPYRLFGWVSDFGASIERPLVGLAGVIVVFWPIIASHLKHAQGVPGTGGIWQGLGVSFSNTFGFLGFGRLMHPEFFVNAPAWLDALSGLQTVLGVVLLFFLGLGLRNRFRLK